MDETKAKTIWKTITDEMLSAKRAGLSNKELAIFTDKRAVVIINKAIRAAYADGLEKAAKLVDSHAGELTREMCDGCGNEDDVATGAMNDQARDIAAEIRQHAKEMGHE